MPVPAPGRPTPSSRSCRPSPTWTSSTTRSSTSPPRSSGSGRHARSAPRAPPAVRSTTPASRSPRCSTRVAGGERLPLRRQPLQVQGLGRARGRVTPTPATARARPTSRGSARPRRCATGCPTVLAEHRHQGASSWPATSTPTRRRTRCRCCTTPATPTPSRSSTTASTRTPSPGCPARWTTSSSTPRRSSRSTGADIWNINSGESIALEYSRYNYHGHRLPPARPVPRRPTTTRWCWGWRPGRPTKTVQVLGINDFHGRIQANGIEAGAGVLAGAVKQLRDAVPGDGVRRRR